MQWGEPGGGPAYREAYQSEVVRTLDELPWTKGIDPTQHYPFLR